MVNSIVDGVAPVRYPPDDVVPLELRERRQWVTWKLQNGTKIPYDATTGRKASSTDSSTWASYEQATVAARRRHHSGIGYVFSADDPYTGVDLDDCIAPDGEIADWALSIISDIQSYTEISPSGTGVKIWVRGTIPHSVKTPQIEMYSQGRYFTVTGNQLSWMREMHLGDGGGELQHLYDYLRPEQPAPVLPIPTALPRVDDDHARLWCLAALEGEHQKMLAAGDGERHNRRYDSAYALGGLIPHLSEDEITAALAVNFGRDAHGAMKTIADGIAAGRQAPRDIPPPLAPTWQARIDAGFHYNAEATGATIPDNPEAERWRQEALYWRMCAEHLQAELAQVKEQNRFVSETHGADNIGAASKRLSFIELTKEIERVPLEEREPEQFVRVRPAVMAARTGQDRGTVSRHLGEFARAGLIEKKVERAYDPETKSWCSEMYVRPIVDLSDPSQVVIPAKPRGRSACTECGSEKLVREVRIICADCKHELSLTQEFVNLPAPDVQTAHQGTDEAASSDDPSDLQTAHQEEIVPIGLMCSLPHIKTTTVDRSSELQTANQAPPSSPRHATQSSSADDWLAYLEQTGRADEAARYRSG